MNNDNDNDLSKSGSLMMGLLVFMLAVVVVSVVFAKAQADHRAKVYEETEELMVQCGPISNFARLAFDGTNACHVRLSVFNFSGPGRADGSFDYTVTNIALLSTHEPVVVKTNGVWLVTFAAAQ